MNTDERILEIGMVRLVQQGRSISAYWAEHLITLKLVEGEQSRLKLTDAGLRKVSEDRQR